MKEQNKIKKPWFNFMASNEWKVFMNIMRVLTFVALIFIIFYIVKEIETFKMIGGACEYCMEKTGCHCFCLD